MGPDLPFPGMLGFEFPGGDQYSPNPHPKAWAALPLRHWPLGVGSRPQAEGPSPMRRPVSRVTWLPTDWL